MVTEQTAEVAYENSVSLTGRLATDPEVRTFDSGTIVVKYLVTVSVEFPRSRVDVIPVSLWDPPQSLVEKPGTRGQFVKIVGGTMQRRFWESPDGRRSRIEVVAETAEVLT